MMGVLCRTETQRWPVSPRTCSGQVLLNEREHNEQTFGADAGVEDPTDAGGGLGGEPSGRVGLV
jgi:hypothetical protein